MAEEGVAPRHQRGGVDQIELGEQLALLAIPMRLRLRLRLGRAVGVLARPTCLALARHHAHAGQRLDGRAGEQVSQPFGRIPIHHHDALRRDVVRVADRAAHQRLIDGGPVAARTQLLARDAVPLHEVEVRGGRVEG